jgi:hypothetical protein
LAVRDGFRCRTTRGARRDSARILSQSLILYEPTTRRPIDVINGGPSLREWVDDPHASLADWDRTLRADEERWIEERRPFLLYG